MLTKNSGTNFDTSWQDPSGGGTSHRARVARTSTLSVPNNTYTRIPWQSEVYDVGGMVDLIADEGRITIVEAGYYQVTAGVRFANNATGVRGAFLTLNGAAFPGNLVAVDGYTSGSAAVVSGMSLATDLLLAAGDYLSLWCIQVSGGALNLETVGTYLTARKV